MNCKATTRQLVINLAREGARNQDVSTLGFTIVDYVHAALSSHHEFMGERSDGLHIETGEDNERVAFGEGVSVATWRDGGTLAELLHVAVTSHGAETGALAADIVACAVQEADRLGLGSTISVHGELETGA